MNLIGERVNHLEVRPDTTFQGAVVLPPGAGGAGLLADAPAMGVWLALPDATLFPLGPATVAQLGPARMLAAFADFAIDRRLAGYLPARVELRDTALGDALRQALAGRQVEVAVLPRLPELDEVTRLAFAEAAPMLEAIGNKPPIQSLVTQPDIDDARLRRFADAADLFYRAEPWKHFDGQDLVAVRAPAVEKPLRFFNVMGQAGQEFGLSFFPTMRDFKRVAQASNPMKAMAKTPLWSVTYDRADYLPEQDVRAWERLKLPLSAADAYPFPVEYRDGALMRPDARILEQMEGLLRAVAASARPSIDESGRWGAQVETESGPVQYRFEMLDPLGTVGAQAMFSSLADLLGQFLDSGLPLEDLFGPAPSPRKQPRRLPRGRRRRR